MSEKEVKNLEDVFILNSFWGLCAMRVCVLNGVLDEKILEVCNSLNPSGTTGGWQKVYKENDEEKDLRPIPCDDYSNRTHYIVAC